MVENCWQIDVAPPLSGDELIALRPPLALRSLRYTM